jgi:molybdate transport system regulatory protein
MKSKPALSSVQPRFRILCGRDIAMGPGKAALLVALRETGSIAEAAARMRMSYMRAWTLIKTMERCFRRPLVKVTRGGRKGGGAELTKTGQEALRVYQQMEADSLQATGSSWRLMQKLLAK